MTTNNAAMADASSCELVFSREINASKELVFEAWTNPDHLQHWWGPNGFTSTFKEINVTPNGLWRFTMHGPDGKDYANRIIFKEIIKPEKITYLHGDDNDSDDKFNVEVSFGQEDNKTLLTMKMTFYSTEEKDNMVNEHKAIDGVEQMLNRLADYLTQMAN